MLFFVLGCNGDDSLKFGTRRFHLCRARSTLYRTLERLPTMKNMILAVSAVSAVAASANAGFQGFVASVRDVGAYTVIDIFAGVSNSSDKFLNAYDMSISTTVAGGFYQAAGLANKTWKPASDFTATRDSIDSFMTAGTYSEAGVNYASTNTNGDPNFNGTSWNGTLGSAAATTVPANAGWYTGNPPSTDNNAESLAGLVGRVNSTGTSSSWGIWISHIVVAGNGRTLGTDVTYSGFASAKDGLSGAVSQGASAFPVPAPGAVALLGLAGFAARRRRA
jgi:MYXO-CTERM domain-containing protein